jgi:leucyl aminopeptidase
LLEHLVQRAGKAIPIMPVGEKRLGAWLKEQSAEVQNRVRANGFTAKPATHLLLTDRQGHASRVLAGVEDGADRWSLAALPGSLAQGTYRLPEDLSAAEATAHAFAWAMGCYRLMSLI